MTCLGPFIQSVGITEDEIGTGNLRILGCITNGLALELVLRRF